MPWWYKKNKPQAKQTIHTLPFSELSHSLPRRYITNAIRYINEYSAATILANPSIRSFPQTILDYTHSSFSYISNQFTAKASSGEEHINRNEFEAIKKSISYVISSKIIPLILLNYANTLLQQYIYSDEDMDPNHSASISVILITELINWTIFAYTFRQSTELVAETLFIDVLAPSAFNLHKRELINLSTHPCIKNNCNYKRRFKGSLREPLLFLFNDLLIKVTQGIPIVGHYAAIMFSIYFSGDLIARSVLSTQNCERHRNLHSEQVFALGFFYVISNFLVDQGFKLSIGLPPYFVYQTIKHFLILWHIHNASYMTLDYVQPMHGTLFFDPLPIYEKITGYGVDKTFNLIKKSIVFSFKPSAKEDILNTINPRLERVNNLELKQQLEKWKKQILSHVSLNSLFTPEAIIKFLCYAFDKKDDDQKLQTYRQKIWLLVRPPIFKSSFSAAQTPVIKAFWPHFIEFLIKILFSDIGDGLRVLSWPVFQKSLPYFLSYNYGFNEDLTTFLLHLFKEEDFNTFFHAFKNWISKHKNDDFVLAINQAAEVNRIGIDNLKPDATNKLFNGLQNYKEGADPQDSMVYWGRYAFFEQISAKNNPYPKDPQETMQSESRRRTTTARDPH